MSKLLLLGDSIRGNYTPFVEKIFANEAAAHESEEGYDKVSVLGPAENCRFSNYTLNSLRFWYEDIRAADVIHWNNGIWDVVDSCDEDRAYTSLTDYLINLRRIYNVLRRENPAAPIIFATTTPINNTERIERDIVRYNEAAVPMLSELGVKINDLYSIVNADRAAFICEDNTHLTEAGASACAEAVVAAYKSVR